MRRIAKRLDVAHCAMIVATAAASCDGEPGTPAFTGSAALRGRSDAEIVFSEQRLWTDETRWRLGSWPDFVIGPEIDADSQRFLYRVGGIERLADGRLVVENRGTYELLVFDSTGAFLTVWGGRGGGPREFSRLGGIFTCGSDRLAVIDFDRVKIFDAGGGLLETGAIPRAMFTSYDTFHGVDVLCESVFMTRWSRPDPLVPTGIGTVADLLHMFWAGISEPQVDTIGSFFAGEFVPVESDGPPAWGFPFSYQASFATDGSTVYYGWGDQPEVAALERDGRATRIIRWNAPPPAITEEEWESYELYRESQDVAHIARSLHPHPVRPYFAPSLDGPRLTFRVSDDGYLWVRHFDQSSTGGAREYAMSLNQWSVFDPEGRWLGEVRTPEGFEVRSIRAGIVWGVAKVGLDVEEVHGYGILMPGGT